MILSVMLLIVLVVVNQSHRYSKFTKIILVSISSTKVFFGSFFQLRFGFGEKFVQKTCPFYFVEIDPLYHNYVFDFQPMLFAVFVHSFELFKGQKTRENCQCLRKDARNVIVSNNEEKLYAKNSKYLFVHFTKFLFRHLCQIEFKTQEFLSL